MDAMLCGVQHGRRVCHGIDPCDSAEQSAYEGIQNIQSGPDRSVGAAVYECNSCMAGVNQLLHAIGIAWNVPWLTDPLWARIGLIVVNIWLGFPYMMNVCLGGLQAILTEYYEAAKMDGASKFQCFKSITLPMVTKLSVPLVISSFASNFNNFGNIYMITQGGPARADNQFAGYTDILASTTYKMTTWSNRYELSAPFSVLIFIIVGTFTLINMRLSGSFKEVD